MARVHLSAEPSCGPKGQDNLAQGLPGVYPGLPIKTCLAVKGLQGVGNAHGWIGGQPSPYGNGPFRAIRLGN
jgi:hypothetical protein